MIKKKSVLRRPFRMQPYKFDDISVCGRSFPNTFCFFPPFFFFLFYIRFHISTYAHGRRRARIEQECKHQFKNRRWNCSTVNDNTVFGPVSALGTYIWMHFPLCRSIVSFCPKIIIYHRARTHIISNISRLSVELFFFYYAPPHDKCTVHGRNS